MRVERCYMCKRAATSREHVPPKNLFPEVKEGLGKDLRVDLITVPSCELHNTAKSQDDEFLMINLAGIVGSNVVGFAHKLQKVMRAISRTRGALFERSFGQKKFLGEIGADLERPIQLVWGAVNIPRLTSCFDKIARGLHFSHFGDRFTGSIRTHLGFLAYEEPNHVNWNCFLTDRAAIDLDGKPRIGENPEVFFYQVTDSDQFGYFLFRLCFYEGLNVYCSFLPRNCKPPKNLAVELMNGGIKTVLTLGDKRYVFN